MSDEPPAALVYLAIGGIWVGFGMLIGAMLYDANVLSAAQATVVALPAVPVAMGAMYALGRAGGFLIRMAAGGER